MRTSFSLAFLCSLLQISHQLSAHPISCNRRVDRTQKITLRSTLFDGSIDGTNENDDKSDKDFGGYRENGWHSERRSQRRDESSMERDSFLDYAIDSFLRGDYAYQFAADAPCPTPSLSPGETVDVALRALRELDHPEPAHGAAVMLRFCMPLSRAERWGDTQMGRDPFKEVLRGSLTAEMFAKHLRASPQFSALLDWTSLDVTDGSTHRIDTDATLSAIGSPSLAYVNAALHFGKGIEPSLIQFSLKRVNGVWLIDTARRSQNELFVSAATTRNKNSS